MAPWYALNLRRGDVNVELTADDPVFMADEMARWLSVMGLPAATQLVSPPQAAPVVPQKPVVPTSLTDRLLTGTSPSVEAEPVTKPLPPQSPEPISSFQPAKGIQLPGEWIEESPEASKNERTLLQELAEPLVEQGPVQLEDTSDWLSKVTTPEQSTTSLESVEQPSLLEPPSNTDEEVALVIVEDEVVEEPVAADWGDTALADRGQPEPDDDFERVMSTLMDDLNTQPTKAVGLEETRLLSQEMSDDDEPGKGVFRKEGMHGSVNVAFPAATDNPNSYKTLCERAGAATPEDHLLISAYALTTSQGVERFSLSDLNVVIQGAGHEMVTHSVLAVAVDKGLLTAVADMTADATQYELTRHGRTTVEMFI
ncbi:MAG: hypothetical protein QE263_01305 [Vampirovibrionales bacterium]|nr:hypothetical protein [Vampirovibrionales bacterium]